MATTFSQVDYDPFAPVGSPGGAPALGAVPASVDASGGSNNRPLTIRGRPSAPSLTPVDYDPFTPPQTWGDTAADVGKSFATGVEKGPVLTATLPIAAGDYVRDKLDTYVFNPLLNRVFGPAPDQPPPQPGTFHDFATNPGNYIGAGAIIDALDKAGLIHQPQSTAGRYAETLGEFVGSGGPTSGAAALKYTVAPAIASEVAGEATQGTVAEPWARAGAALATGGVGALASRPGTAGAALRDAAGPLDQSTVDAAQKLMDAAQAQGTPLSLAEAVQQVTNSGTRLGSLQRVVEQSRGGADPMARFYANRPAQVQAAGDAAISRIGTPPPVPVDGSVGPVPPNPAAVGPLVQDAAQSAIGASPAGQNASAAIAGMGPRVTPEQAGSVIQPGLRQVYDARHDARSTQARQDYAAAARDTVPAESVQAILDDLGEQMRADKTGLLASRLGDLRNRLSTPAPKTGLELDPAYEGAPSGSSPPFGPTEDYNPPVTASRPAIPRPQSLQDFIRSAGGIQDRGGDLKAMGFDTVRGMIAKPGQGLSADAMRQAAAQAGYLGADIDHAMAATTPNDLFDALERHPVYSVHDAGSTAAWQAYDQSKADADVLGPRMSRSAAPPSAPGFPDIDPAATVTQRQPITDIANLNRTRKTFNERIGLPATAPRAIDKETAATIGPVLQRLDQVMQDGSSAYATANRNFAANSVPLEPFEHTPALSKTVEQDAYGKRFLTPPEQVPGLIDQGGPSTARAFTGVAPNPVQRVYEQHLTTQLLDRATGSNGLVSADKLAAMVRDNADTLRQFPAVQARVQRVIDTQRALEPMRNTMVGRLAASPSFREQASIILDPNPVPGSAGEVGNAVRQVAAQNPHAAQALVAQRIRQVFSEATQNNMGGPNQGGAAKFDAAIRGNGQQARNLKAAVEALHGPGFWRDFQKTLDVFQAMGKRQPAGSLTEPNRQIATELRKGGKLGTVVSTALSPTKALGKAQEIYEGWKWGRNTDALANLLTRPDAAKVLGEIAKASPDSSRAQGMATLYLLGAAANQGRKAVP